MGTRGSTGGSRTRGSGSGSVDMGRGVSVQGGRSFTRGGFIGSGCLLMRSGGIALGNIMGGWSLSTGGLSGRCMITGLGERPGKKYGGLSQQPYHHRIASDFGLMNAPLSCFFLIGPQCPLSSQLGQ